MASPFFLHFPVEPGLVVGTGLPAAGPGFVGVGPGPALDYDYFDGPGGFSGLPRCSYINTDFFGDDVGDGRGLTAASPFDCKRVRKSHRSLR